jgi:hypothetical protein
MNRFMLVSLFLYLSLNIVFVKEVTGDSILEEASSLKESTQEEEDQVCVTLEKFESGCSGHVQSTNTFTALTKPGSPCKHTVNMKNNSAKDQYCTFQNGKTIFHQTVYIRNKECKVDWEEKAISPMKLTYTEESCTYGYKLKSCVLGPCQESPVVSLVDFDIIA